MSCMDSISTQCSHPKTLYMAVLDALAPAAVACVVYNPTCPYHPAAQSLLCCVLLYPVCCTDIVTLQKEEVKQDVALLNPQERVSAVRPMWEQRGHADRVELLTVDLSSLKQEAEQQAEKARASAGTRGTKMARLQQQLA